MPTTLERPRMCALCGTTNARRGSSLCTACAEDIDWRDSYEFPVDNFPTCNVCGGELRRGHCWSCIEESLRDTKVPA